ncbi:DoxX family protein [Planotetraspora kaengkrachanensis]|uniref:DoxX family protein n=1 Tax=Planotetraspora kaengkrachanensis TaxID=575193 RepID=A0A8J3PZH1_9ACTN|nr:DoxX family protein [Planotetraspora kaengkrachanensis]GIG83949.1 hypothetical protein Pka01_70760 [Planotetraspora kaengkrachanensis]
MNIVLWVLQSILALLYLFAGIKKTFQSRAALAPQMGWVEDLSDGQVKLIGVLELLGAIGLILPAALDIAPILTPLAATGLALVQVGAIPVHLRRSETKLVPFNVILLVLAAIIAWGRFGPWAF